MPNEQKPKRKRRPRVRHKRYNLATGQKIVIGDVVICGHGELYFPVTPNNAVRKESHGKKMDLSKPLESEVLGQQRVGPLSD